MRCRPRRDCGVGYRVPFLGESRIHPRSGLAHHLSYPPPRMTTRQLSVLRSQAQRLDTLLKLGKNGITDSFVQEVGTALDQHELIKVKLIDHKDQRRTLAPELATKSGSTLVTLIGNVIVLYRANPDPTKRKVHI